MIAGGGTGGHLYPALAIAEHARDAIGAEVLFVGTRAGIEARVIPEKGFSIYYIKIGSLARESLLRKLTSLIAIPLALLHSVFLLLKLRPNVVLGVGGYASGPTLLMASFLGFPCALWDSNAHPGKTNRILSRFVRHAFLYFQRSGEFLSSPHKYFFGVPLRKAMKPKVRTPSPEMHLLIFGGSQGARPLNEIALRAFSEPDQSWNDGARVVLQTGKLDYQKVYNGLKDHPRVKVHQFLDPMSDYYDWADLVICRAGAGTVGELAMCQKPAIFVPLPTAADDHQKKNAQEVVKVGAAEMIEQRDFSPESIKSLIRKWKSQKEHFDEMGQRFSRFAFPQAAEDIVLKLVEIAKK